VTDHALLVKLIKKNGREAVLTKLSPDERLTLPYVWPLMARPKQIAPDWPWFVWLLLSGRGFGKSRTGAEYIRERAESGVGKRMALVGQTVADCRDVMVKGDSGLLSVCPPWNKPTYQPSTRTVTWDNPNFPSYGAVAFTYSGDEPDQLRGPQHDTCWADEVAKYKYLRETWDNLLFGMRLGDDPRIVVTTTPRPLKFLKNLRKRKDTHVTTGSSYENLANLAKVYKDVLEQYKGTRLERQEIEGEILDEVEGALLSIEKNIDPHRVRAKDVPDLERIVIPIDPAVTSTEDADETGIVPIGLGVDRHLYVLEDASCRLPPEGWARRAVERYDKWEADKIIAEVNNGGDLVGATVKTVRAHVPFKNVRASRGKHIRFEPVSALYEQGRVHHVGSFPVLEDQLCGFTASGYEGDGSPDHADSLVWGATELVLDRDPEPRIRRITL